VKAFITKDASLKQEKRGVSRKNAYLTLILQKLIGWL
jgi:hypothetical protein